jgi:PBP1b-binding outer membrane lipoprotein LpoB
MKKLSLAAIVIVISFLISSCSAWNSGKSNDEKISQASFPMDRSEFIERLNNSIINTCKESQERHNVSQAECVSLINNKIPACLKTTSIPETINDKEQFKDIGKQYVGCLMPYYFCNGVEVKTDEEIKSYCK